MSKLDSNRGQKLLDYASMVERAAEYCHHLSENWRQASRKTAEYTSLDLVQVVNEERQVIFFGNAAIQLSGLTAARVKRLQVRVDARVSKSPEEHAIEAGGEERCEVSFARAGDTIEATIADNGSGGAPDAMKRALPRGFTSKQSGTGLGLSICRHLLGTHGATFEMTSTLGTSTTVRIVFPAVAAT